MHTELDVVIVGGGQAGLACGYYLRRTNLRYLIIDSNAKCGGSWPHYWDSLNLFSTARHSSLPGWLMPSTKGKFPTRDEVVEYLCEYEKRYSLNVRHGETINQISSDGNKYKLESDRNLYSANVIIAAMGRFGSPYVPEIEGRHRFKGMQIHSSSYKNANGFRGKNVLVVGEGNSGAQIFADLIPYAEKIKWAYLKKPKFLPPDIDGEVLFDQASARYYAQQRAEQFDPKKFSLGNIVQVPTVKKALEEGRLKGFDKISRLTRDGLVWESGLSEDFDFIIWCTGFKYNTDLFSDLIQKDKSGKVNTSLTKVDDIKGLWMVGYGNWTGFASATLIGVGRSARQTIKEVEAYCKLNAMNNEI